jgi:hypothetical protein
LQQRKLQEQDAIEQSAPAQSAPTQNAPAQNASAQIAQERPVSEPSSQANNSPLNTADNASAAVSSNTPTSTQNPTSTTDAAPAVPTFPTITTTAPVTDTANTPNPLSRLPQAVGHMVRIRAIVSGKEQNNTVMLPLSGASVGQALRLMGITLGRSIACNLWLAAPHTMA